MSCFSSFQKAGLGIGPIAITSDREDIADFTEPFHSVSIAMVMRNSPDAIFTLLQIFKPLSTLVWLLILGATVVLSIALYSIDHLTSGVTKTNVDGLQCVWIIFSTLLLRNVECKNALSIRILNGSVWFGALLLILCYSANLTAFLATTSIGNKIYTVHDLVGQTTTRFGTVRNSHISAFFQNSKVPSYQRIWHAMSSFNNSWMVSSAGEGLARVQSDRQDYAFLWDTSDLQLKLFADCAIDVVDRIHRIMDYAFVVPQGAPYKEGMSMAILRLRESGRLEEIERR